jgi:hypothetical protein
MRPSVQEVLKVAELIGQANTALGRVYEILINSNQTGRRFDYMIVLPIVALFFNQCYT